MNEQEHAQDLVWQIVRDVIDDAKGAYDLTLYGNVEAAGRFWRISVVDVEEGTVIGVIVAMEDMLYQAKWETVAKRNTLNGLVREHYMNIARNNKRPNSVQAQVELMEAQIHSPEAAFTLMEKMQYMYNFFDKDPDFSKEARDIVRANIAKRMA